MLKVILSLAFALVILAGCKNEGVKAGLVLQECSYVLPNERENLAKEVKMMTRDQGINHLALSKNITVEQAATCFK